MGIAITLFYTNQKIGCLSGVLMVLELANGELTSEPKSETKVMHRYESVFFSQDLNRLIRSPIGSRKDSRRCWKLFSNFNSWRVFYCTVHYFLLSVQQPGRRGTKHFNITRRPHSEKGAMPRTWLTYPTNFSGEPWLILWAFFFGVDIPHWD